MTADRPEPELPELPDDDADDPLHQESPHPHKPGREFSADPAVRARELRQVLAAAVVIIVVAAVAVGRLSWWWLFVPVFVVVMNLATRRAEREQVNRSAHFRRPGDHRLVLQVTGPRPIHVIRELRSILGADLVTAKKLAESAPVVLLEHVDATVAAEAVYLLTEAGAKATTYAVEEDE